MNQLTTQQILKILPMSEDIRTDILTKFDGFNEDQKLSLRKLCWTMFFQLYNDQVNYEFQKTLLEVKDKKRGLQKNMYQKIEDQVFNQLKQKLLIHADKSAVENVRSKLQQFFRAKKAPLDPNTPTVAV